MTSSIGVQNARKAKRKKKERAGVLAEMIVVIADADRRKRQLYGKLCRGWSRRVLTLRHPLGLYPIVFLSHEIVSHPIELIIPCVDLYHVHYVQTF